jgi:hypothetical protein
MISPKAQQQQELTNDQILAPLQQQQVSFRNRSVFLPDNPLNCISTPDYPLSKKLETVVVLITEKLSCLSLMLIR